MLKNQQQRENKKAGLGDKDGKMASNNKAPQTKAKCTVCMQEIVMVKVNTQARAHAENKHGKKLSECFPGYE